MDKKQLIDKELGDLQQENQDGYEFLSYLFGSYGAVAANQLKYGLISRPFTQEELIYAYLMGGSSTKDSFENIFLNLNEEKKQSLFDDLVMTQSDRDNFDCLLLFFLRGYKYIDDELKEHIKYQSDSDLITKHRFNAGLSKGFLNFINQQKNVELIK